jgi:hypothetical protein
MGISKTDELKNSGASKIIDLLASEAKVAEMTLADDMSDDIFGTTSATNGIQGFPLMVDSDSTDYAGIGTGDFSNWTAQESSTNTVTLGVLQGMFGDCSDMNEVPTVLFTLQDVFDKIWQLYEVKPEFRVQNYNSNQGGMKFQGAPLTNTLVVVVVALQIISYS